MKQTIFFGVLCGLLLAGCGQKGALYLPQPTTIEQSDNTPADTQSANDQTQY